MLNLPSHVLEKLRCAQCGGYLSYTPLVINEENRQLCGRCFRTLPDRIKTRCLRQIGLEAIAEILIFPCRYNTQGCGYTFSANDGAEHEISCPHRNNSLPLRERNNNTEEDECEQIDLNVRFDNIYQNEEALKINIDLRGKNGNKLCLDDEEIMLCVELAVLVDQTPEISYSHVKIKNFIEEPLYDVIQCQQVTCGNCQKSLLTTELFHCGFGHSVCKSCRNNSCKICGVLPNSNSLHYCKNYPKGCHTPFETNTIVKHEIDCEFNDFVCRLCGFSDSLNILVDHFLHSHDCILSNELSTTLTKRDTEWYFYCFNKLFLCRYYYLCDSIEFLVSYIGSNDTASNHIYKVAVSSDSNKMKKTAKCLGWNEISLNKCVSFELDNASLKNLQVLITIH